MATQAEIFGAVDHSHSAGAKLLQYAIVKDRLPAQIGGVKLRNRFRRRPHFNLLRIELRGGLGRLSAARHLAEETVASAGQSLDVAGPLGRFSESIPQPLYRGVDAVIELDNRGGRP